MSTSTGNYKMSSTGVIDAEDLLLQTTSIKELLNLEFVTDEDNILLNKYVLKLLYEKLLEIETRLSSLER